MPYASYAKAMNKAKNFFFSSYLDRPIWKGRFEFSNLTLLGVSHWNVLEVSIHGLLSFMSQSIFFMLKPLMFLSLMTRSSTNILLWKTDWGTGRWLNCTLVNCEGQRPTVIYNQNF